MISSNLKNRIFTSIFLFLLLALALINNFIMTYCLIIFGVLSLMEFFNLTKKIFVKSFYYFFTNIIFSIYIFIFFFLFFFFSNIIQLKIILFAFLLGCIASDIGGFVFGKIFKGPKLSSISPKKTISGAIGSLFLTCAFLSLSVNYFINIFTYKIIIIAIATSIACQCGDLFFSFLKRKAKIKDTGNLLPGHGGILDRLDGILFGLPVSFLIFTLVH